MLKHTEHTEKYSFVLLMSTVILPHYFKVEDAMHLEKATRNYTMFTFLWLCIKKYTHIFQFLIKPKMVFVKSMYIMLITHAQQARYYIN